MSTAVGLRDQRLRFYARSDAGRDGNVRAVFSFVAPEAWGRLDESSSQVAVFAQRLQLKIDAVAEVADEITVPVHGICKDPDGVLWWIRGINRVRQLRRVLIGVERVTEDVAVTTILYENASTLDGTHLVDPVI